MKTLIVVIAVVTLVGTGLLVWVGEKEQPRPFETRKPTLEIVP